MGLAPHSIRFLVDSHRAGVSFERTLMVGRQNVFGSPMVLDRVLRDAGLLPPGDDPLGLRSHGLPWAEPVFSALGASRIDSMDASDIERPTIVHDLNLPVPAELECSFDCVYDGGTLEHVFNLPVALRSCMAMVKVGGHLLLDTPANNLMGHGFYQFSPELYYSALSDANGFQVERVIAVEDGKRWYEVRSPRDFGTRVELTNCRPVSLLVRARRIADVPIFAAPPQQSDYAALWSSSTDGPPPVDRLAWVKRLLRKRAPRVADLAQLLLVHWREIGGRRAASFNNREIFRPVSDAARSEHGR